MLDYGALAAVAAVAREGSFDRAAAMLGVTPSAVSQRVRALEERLGAVLIARGQPCVATAIGAQLCSHVERVRVLERDVVAALPQLGALDREGPVAMRIAVNADSLTTWFPPAAARFAWETGALLDLVLDDEEHTAGRLRSGDVLAAITADPEPVQGCRLSTLGALRYVPTASPAFVAHHFPDGVGPDAIQRAPVLRFDRRDRLQAKWAQATLGVELAAPVHWVPSTRAFVDLTLAGLGWALNPEALVEEHLRAGRLVELLPGSRRDVLLHWQVSRVGATLLDTLTGAVRAAAAALVRTEEGSGQGT